jgi:aminobenzoyl-glutamate utilization protein A
MGFMTEVALLRRDFHRFPEVGFCEFRTASRAAGILHDLGWDVRIGTEAIDPAARLGVPPPGELDSCWQRAGAEGGDQRFLPAMRGGLTAVVATLNGDRPGPVIAIRADMDALPLTESQHDEHLPVREGFASVHDGVMHACGHDGHLAIALDLARLLAGDRDFPGTVKLLLEPAEEGGRGAAAMVAARAADDVDLFLALHLGLGLPSGAVCPSVQGLMANSKLTATFHGKAAHASASPHLGRHALLGAAAAALAIHTMPHVPGHETRVNVGSLHSGTTSNIVPDQAELRLETRADDAAINHDLETRARAMLTGTATAYGLTLDIELTGTVPTATSDPAAARLVTTAAQQAGLPLIPAALAAASDDACAFMRRIQHDGGLACYLALGAGDHGPHHSRAFDIDESALPAGVLLLEQIIRTVPAPLPAGAGG